MLIKPTLHLTNFSSRKLHIGRVFTIMARPRSWEHGAGVVTALQPKGETSHLMIGAIADRRNADAMHAYRTAMESRWQLNELMLRPGILSAINVGESAGYIVADGDTLCCACARGAECHRRWAAPFLARAGWAVVLDGEPFPLPAPSERAEHPSDGG